MSFFFFSYWRAFRGSCMHAHACVLCVRVLDACARAFPDAGTALLASLRFGHVVLAVEPSAHAFVALVRTKALLHPAGVVPSTFAQLKVR